MNDVLNLIPLAEEFDFADKDKWGIEGWSRGGMMTYLALTKNYNFKCAIVLGHFYSQTIDKKSPNSIVL